MSPNAHRRPRTTGVFNGKEMLMSLQYDQVYHHTTVRFLLDPPYKLSKLPIFINVPHELAWELSVIF